ncbi:WXG100 family type VII secretion target [Kitasatospora sp. NBC_01539]|uniref:WXG100 family type VII secretion target n=1 Tax=Kitasatospora sp. NBC_01539 TaxID=2903577 RepID=UPI0038601F85
MGNRYSNFNDHSHAAMIDMVQSMDSGGVMAASDPWRNAASTLKQIRTALNTASADATSSWEGATSDAFHTKMTNLADVVNNAAAYANDAAVALEMMSEAIDTAKRDMPEEPGFWDKAGDAISDTAKSTVGVDDEDTRTGVADEKKAQAVAVMEVLATKYRAATTFLKPPRPGIDDEITDLPPSDSGGAGALAGLIMGGGMGFAGAGQSSSGTAARASSSRTSPQGAVTAPKQSAGPTDSGIKGGTANPTPTPKAPSGPGTGIDGVVTGVKPGAPGSGTGAGGLVNGAGDGGIHGVGGVKGGGGATGVTMTGPTGGTGLVRGSGSTTGGTGLVRGSGSTTGGTNTGAGRAFGASGMGEGGAGAGKGGAGGRSGAVGRRAGGVIGEAGGTGRGGGAFTEGGSGLGRGRGAAGQGAAGQGHGGMPGSSQAGKKEKKKGSDRPDYLVEDEETWVSGDRVNPNVVE